MIYYSSNNIDMDGCNYMQTIEFRILLSVDPYVAFPSEVRSNYLSYLYKYS